MITTFLLFLVIYLNSSHVFAATAEQWRGRSIYQLIVDRYALPPGADLTACDPGAATWCGGTWNTVTQNLDYIQDAGFTAIWISPINQNYQGPRTAYGDPYHGYWMADVRQLNDRFGTADDLKALSAELHRRGMYLMVDVVVNDVMATSTTPDLSTYMFTEQDQYHPFCWVNFSDPVSEEECWLGDQNVPLPDINTENPTVVSGFQSWITNMVQEYDIDGLRIDAAKHVNMAFWPPFCQAAGVYCIGEVFDPDVPDASQWQGPQALDAILNYPLYTALVETFTIPGPRNTSALVDVLNQSRALFPDPGLLGNFLEDQDVPRWHNLSVDVQSLFNAMTFTFMSDGIPIVYYGQEQGFSGNADPYNREPLWPSGYAKTDIYNMTTTLNQVRNFLINSTDSQDWLHSKMQVLTANSIGIAFMKGNVVTVLTNIGSPPQNSSITLTTPFSASTAMTNILTCQQWAVGSGGSVEVDYSKGGVPVILVPSSLLANSPLCQGEVTSTATIKAPSSALSDRTQRHWMANYIALGFLVCGVFGIHI
jgi:alpha-amylase